MLSFEWAIITIKLFNVEIFLTKQALVNIDNMFTVHYPALTEIYVVFTSLALGSGFYAEPDLPVHALTQIRMYWLKLGALSTF